MAWRAYVTNACLQQTYNNLESLQQFEHDFEEVVSKRKGVVKVEGVNKDRLWKAATQLETLKIKVGIWKCPMVHILAQELGFASLKMTQGRKHKVVFDDTDGSYIEDKSSGCRTVNFKDNGTYVVYVWVLISA